jgi:holo-[acyl-carrier protein] synthase
LVIAIGLDTVDVARFREVLARRPRLLERVFTKAEQDECGKRADPVPGLAARFAAKEATMKALGVGLGGFALRDVQVVRSPSGAPLLTTTGRASELAAAAGIDQLLVSLTHSGLVASAVVVAT